jgi:hypothetical protein
MSIIPEITPIDFEQASAAILIQLRQLTQSITGFGFLTKARRRQITTSASVPDAFLKSTAITCDAQPDLGRAGDVTSSELRQVIEFTRAFNSVADELELLAKGLRDTVAGQRFDVARKALRVYALAKTFDGPTERTLLVPHLKNMKRDLGRSRTKLPAEPETPADSSTSATPATPAAPATPAPLPPPPLLRKV